MTKRRNVKGRQGFTLMELLVVLLIIGILSTVALRTIDATRDRSLFDQTTKEMNQLVQAMVGNPDLTYDGRRVDFGFFGDMTKLPNGLHDLMNNPSGLATWHGPYLRRTAAGDTAGYLLDGWGHLYIYNPTEGTIQSLGNGKYPMTVSVADSLAQLYFNTISGTITDADGNPPGIKAMGIMTVTFYYNNGDTNLREVTIPDRGGYYEFSPNSPHGVDTVPIGIHRMVVAAPGMDTLTRWVTVVPRSHTVVDFKFSQLFRNQLRMVGAPVVDLSDTAGFLIRIVNTGTVDATITMLEFIDTPESAYMRDFRIDENLGNGFPKGPMDYGTGPKDTVSFPSVTIAPHMEQQVDLLFQHFYVDSAGPSAVPPNDTTTNVPGKVFRFRFDDGSEIIVRP